MNISRIYPVTLKIKKANRKQGNRSSFKVNQCYLATTEMI